MFRLPVILLLFTALLTQSMSRGIILLSYFTNKAAYERYCVNKSSPQLRCAGKCQVAQKIKAEAERDSKDPLKSNKFSETFFISQHSFAHIEALPVFTGPVSPSLPLTLGCLLHMPRSIFHPPDILA